MSTWSAEVAQLRARLPDDLRDKVAEWLDQVAIPITERILNQFPHGSLAHYPYDFPTFLVELLIPDVADGVDQILGLRYTLQELERDFVLLLLGLVSEERLSSAEEEADPLVRAQREALAEACSDVVAAGDPNIAATASEILRRFAGPLGANVDLDLAKAKREEMQAIRAMKLAQIEQDGGPLNFGQRSERITDRLFWEIRETYRKSIAASAGLARTLRITEYEMRNYSGDKVGLEPPHPSEPAYIDQLVAWVETATALMERKNTEEHVETIILPITGQGGFMSQEAFDAAMAAAANGMVDINVTPAHIPHRKRVRLRAVGVSFPQYDAPSSSSDRYERMKLARYRVRVHPPEQADTLDSLLTWSRPPLSVFAQMIGSEPMEMVSGEAIFGADPLGRWTLAVAADLLDPIQRQGPIKRWDILRNLFLHLEIVSAPDPYKANWD
jgi:hypothetical protein